MPLYEFYCADCREKFELFTSYQASAGEIVCAKCHGGRVRKMFSVFAARRGAGGAFADGYDGGEYGGYGDDGGEMGMGGGCSCGGACSCGGH